MYIVPMIFNKPQLYYIICLSVSQFIWIHYNENILAKKLVALNP